MIRARFHHWLKFQVKDHRPRYRHCFWLPKSRPFVCRFLRFQVGFYAKFETTCWSLRSNNFGEIWKDVFLENWGPKTDFLENTPGKRFAQTSWNFYCKEISLRYVCTKTSDLYRLPVRRYDSSNLAKIVMFASITEIHRIPRIQPIKVIFLLTVEFIDL